MQHLIFDFDGTLVDSAPLVLSSLSKYMERSHHTSDELRDMSSREALQVLGISKLEIPKLILKVRHDFKAKIQEQPLVEGMAEALRNLKKQGYQLHVVSSNSEENIDQFLTLHHLREQFSSITSFFTVFGKAHGLSKLLTQVQADPQDAIYIGDETRDIEAANKVGVQSLAVCWGYNSERILKEHQPTQMAATPQAMVSLLGDVFH